MRKGFAEEILGFVVVIFTLILLVIFFASQRTLKGEEVTLSVSERDFDEHAKGALRVLHQNKLETINKTYIELMIDSLMDKATKNKKHVYYGPVIGTIYTEEEIINPLFNEYYGNGKWELVLNLNDTQATYGKLKEKAKRKYISPVPILHPVQKTNIGNVTLYV